MLHSLAKHCLTLANWASSQYSACFVVVACTTGLLIICDNTE